MGERGHPPRHADPATEQLLARAVRNGIDKAFIEGAAGFWKRGKRRKTVTPTQVRNVFGAVKKMELTGTYNAAQLLLLRPRLRWALARAKDDDDHSFETFVLMLENAINEVVEGTAEEQQEKFNRFCQGFEAVLAYHKDTRGESNGR